MFLDYCITVELCRTRQVGTRLQIAHALGLYIIIINIFTIIPFWLLSPLFITGLIRGFSLQNRQLSVPERRIEESSERRNRATQKARFLSRDTSNPIQSHFIASWFNR
ncbi:hypothetical protein DPEC_G00343830 [Dallia pectoralis]|uniref:Uncharacterized protein n=1 Tax=Dallia pectoralis TaxID=75939 RepID=A0ACC2F2Y2_DALPE|nr:hypothetical protein DPEC_G00343830 [Dallia pectoralis]